MSLPKMETGHTCPQCAGGPLRSLSSFLNRTSEPDGCALGAHVTQEGDASANVDSGRQSSAYLRPNPIAAIYDPLKNKSFWAR
jgi:hypothetical protein